MRGKEKGGRRRYSCTAERCTRSKSCCLHVTNRTRTYQSPRRTSRGKSKRPPINTARNNALFLDQRQKFISTKTVQPKSKQRIVSSRLFFHFSTRITTITLLENVIEYNFIDLILFFPDIQGGRGEEIKNSSFFYKILKFNWIDFRCCFHARYIRVYLRFKIIEIEKFDNKFTTLIITDTTG